MEHHDERVDRDAPAPTPARRGLRFGLGIALTVIGLIGVLTYALMPRNTPAEGEGTADGLLQSGLIIGSALLTGLGILLIMLGVAMARRERAGRES
ncbi:hypothetical protein [Agromyces salentinus]|nr:hypothetical protein [Agromyces salentinus]